MNLKQAMVMMSLGLRVTKTSWMPDEYVYLKNGEVWDENHNAPIWESLFEFEIGMQINMDVWSLFDKPEAKTDAELFK